MKTTFSSAVRALGGAVAVTAALAATVQADTVLTVNADGTVSQVDSTQTTGGANYGTHGNASRGNAGFAGATASQQGYAVQGQGYAYPAGQFAGNAAAVSSHGVDAQGRKIVVKPGDDVIINGDKTKIVIKPGYGYGYPVYGYPYPYPVYGYPGHGYPGYGYPGYGHPRPYPVHGYPGYGYPGYGYPGYGYPTYGQPGYGYPYYGGTYGSTFGGTLSGRIGGVTVGIGMGQFGVGQQSVTTRSTTTVMPGTTVTTTVPGGMVGLPSPYVSPAQRPF